jgi:hypothetical protein
MHRGLRSGHAVGVVLLTLGTTTIAPARSSASATAAGRCGAPTIPVLAVTTGRSPRARGAVLIAAGPRRIIARATRGPVSVRGRRVWLRFCLRPGRVSGSITLVRVAPDAVTLDLTRGRKLTLSGSGRAGLRHPRAFATARAERVALLLERRPGRAIVFVDGHRRATVPARLAGSLRIVVGTGAVVPAPGTAGFPAAGAPAPSASAGPTSNPPAPVTPAAASVVPYNPFSPTSFWNARLSSTAAIDPSSPSYVSDLVTQVTRYGPWLNTTAYSAPVYVVPATQPAVPVTLTVWGPDLQQAFDAVPIPAGATAAAGTDQSMAVWQPATDRMWDFWHMRQANGAWSAAWGGEMDGVSTNPGYYTHVGQTSYWGATATGLPLLGGMITLADLQRGQIDHALAIGVPETERSVFSWPAQRTDGWSTAATALPEGIRFRLDPSVNVAGLGLPRLDEMLAAAAQTYGIVLRDTSGAVTFYGQDPTPTGTDPFVPVLGGVSLSSLLAQFPWNRLEALPTSLTG